MAAPKRKALATVLRLPAIVSVRLVRVYQLTLSPDHGPLKYLYRFGYCRHQPTCSAFAILSLETLPFHIAVYVIARRLATCHPWHEPSDERLMEVIAKT